METSCRKKVTIMMMMMMMMVVVVVMMMMILNALVNEHFELGLVIGTYISLTIL